MFHVCKTTAVAGLAVITLLSQGCALLSQRSAPSTIDFNKVDELEYTVKPGDSLSTIAVNLTGNVNHWEAIARHNGIADPLQLSEGDTLLISRSLLTNVYSIEDTLPTSGEELLTDPQQSIDAASAAANTVAPSTAIGSTMAVKRVNDHVSDEAISHAVLINRHFDLVPMDLAEIYRQRAISGQIRSEVELTPAPSRNPETDSAFIKVVGSYYPKGIYAGPGSYTKLMMRVLPGTVFELDSEVNDWYKVRTNQGVGYVRSSDAIPVSDSSS